MEKIVTFDNMWDKTRPDHKVMNACQRHFSVID